MFKRITIALLAMLMLAMMTTTVLAGKEDPAPDPEPDPTDELLPVGDADDVRYIDGMLGIGTSAPQSNLDVVGHAQIRGNLKVIGPDLSFGESERGDGGRAMVHWLDDSLVINFLNDFSGGVRINGRTRIASHARVDSNLSVFGNDFAFGGSDRGDGGRALVHDFNDCLRINFGNDFAGGVQIGGSTSIVNNLSVGGNLGMTGNDFSFYSSDRGDGGRAMVHDASDALTINYANDFTGGVKIASGLSVSGNGTFTGTVTTGSSRELKNNIAKLTGNEAVEALMSLMPVKYNYKTNSDELELGFIAEDVPDLVARNDRKSLSPMDFATLSVTVIQEQQREIQQQKEEYQEQMSMLLERIAALEAAANRK